MYVNLNVLTLTYAALTCVTDEDDDRPSKKNKITDKMAKLAALQDKKNKYAMPRLPLPPPGFVGITSDTASQKRTDTETDETAQTTKTTKTTDAPTPSQPDSQPDSQTAPETASLPPSQLSITSAPQTDSQTTTTTESQPDSQTSTTALSQTANHSQQRDSPPDILVHRVETEDQGMPTIPATIKRTLPKPQSNDETATGLTQPKSRQIDRDREGTMTLGQTTPNKQANTTPNKQANTTPNKHTNTTPNSKRPGQDRRIDTLVAACLGIQRQIAAQGDRLGKLTDGLEAQTQRLQKLDDDLEAREEASRARAAAASDKAEKAAQQTASALDALSAKVCRLAASQKEAANAQPVRLPDTMTTLAELHEFEGRLEDRRYKSEMVRFRQFPTAKTSMSLFASIFANQTIGIKYSLDI